MKKFLLILSFGAFVAACNDTATTTTEDKKDSVENKIDSSAEAKKDLIDSSADAQKAALDSSAKTTNDSAKTKK
jgi:hypothetical protein